MTDAAKGDAEPHTLFGTAPQTYRALLKALRGARMLKRASLEDVIEDALLIAREHLTPDQEVAMEASAHEAFPCTHSQCVAHSRVPPMLRCPDCGALKHEGEPWVGEQL